MEPLYDLLEEMWPGRLDQLRIMAEENEERRQGSLI